MDAPNSVARSRNVDLRDSKKPPGPPKKKPKNPTHTRSSGDIAMCRKARGTKRSIVREIVHPDEDEETAKTLVPDKEALLPTVKEPDEDEEPKKAKGPMSLTEEEKEKLLRAGQFGSKDMALWCEVCDACKKARDGLYPSDWSELVYIGKLFADKGETKVETPPIPLFTF